MESNEMIVLYSPEFQNVLRDLRASNQVFR